jgi:hypothetical protein
VSEERTAFANKVEELSLLNLFLPWFNLYPQEDNKHIRKSKDYTVEHLIKWQPLYRVFSAQADWTLNFRSTVSSDSPQPLAEKNAAALTELLANIVYLSGVHPAA